MAQEPENLVLTQLQAIRRDQTAALEQTHTLARQMSRIAETHVDVQRSIGDIKVTLTEMRSDIVQLENMSLTRHNEILTILDRLDETDRKQREVRNHMSDEFREVRTRMEETRERVQSIVAPKNQPDETK